jgi:hypothetical protein
MDLDRGTATPLQIVIESRLGSAFCLTRSAEDWGERIVLATNRPRSAAELLNQPRTIEYPFTIIELRVNRSGEGDGTLSLVTKVIPDKTDNIVTLENYDMQRIRLRQVKRESAN